VAVAPLGNSAFKEAANFQRTHLQLQSLASFASHPPAPTADSLHLNVLRLTDVSLHPLAPPPIELKQAPFSL
jgi:hypothetical protein